jgi:hypothetical protein
VNFSALQWVMSFLVDALIKSVIFVTIGVGMTSTSPFPFLLGAIQFTIINFVCLFLGYTAVIAFELVGKSFGPTATFWLTVLFANILFGVSLNTVFGLQEGRSKVFEISPVMIALVVTNLVSLLFVIVGSCTIRRIAKCARRPADA